MSQIVVTGGAGFIGSHIADRLISEGHRVLVVDNLSTGKRRHLPPEAEFMELDITDEGLRDCFVRFRPEAVIHHAAQVSVNRSIHDLIEDARINIMGSLNVIEAARASGARKVIYASSAAAYGIPDGGLISEHHAINPISYYGVSKHTPEHYLPVAAHLHGLEFTVLRYANVYGSRQDAYGEGGVVSIFASKLLAGERPVIYGDGEQTRDFVHVQDIVEANLAALSRGNGSILNIGMSRSTSINELLRTMCTLAGVPFAPEYRERRQGDIVHSRLDNRAAMQELNWMPRYSLQEGLKETMSYYKRMLSQKVS